MRKRNCWIAALGALFVVGSLNSASAVTLASLLAGGSLGAADGCLDKVFDNWTDYSSTDFGSGAGVVDPNFIEVTCVAVGPNEVNLVFSSSGWFAGPGQAQDTSFQYDAHATGGAFDRNSLHLTDGGATGTGFVRIGELKTDTDNPPNSYFLFVSSGGPLDAVTPIDPTSHNLHVAKDIALQGGTGIAFVSDFTQDYHEVVPEPGTIAMLMGMGVSGSVFMIRRRTRTK